MARNEQIEVYGIPQIYKNRYNHHWTSRRKTTFNVGDIQIIYNRILIQPGDTLSMSVRSFLRLTTSLFPSMDNLTADIYAFAEDWQNVWEHTKEFWGEDEATPFETLPEYTIPELIFEPGDVIEHDDIIHHISMPQMKANQGTIETEVRNINVSTEVLSYRTYLDIYNRFFRDQNYIPKIEFSKGDEDLKYSEVTQKKLLKAARFHDYYHGTPEAQKGEPEFLPLGTEAPIMTGTVEQGAGQNLPGTDGLIWYDILRQKVPDNLELQTSSSGTRAGMWSDAGGFNQRNANVYPANLYADLTNAVGATVNALRLITATQHIKEELMWYGSRFNEIIFSQWGVDQNAATMRIPEYLGGIKIDLNMDTVLQTSSTNSQSPQGNAAGYSVTLDEGFLFTKSFTTWQIVQILIVVRQDHTYAQGQDRQYQKRRKYDFYWDEFAGLGAQPRNVSEICLNGNEKDKNVWNFAPAWREYISDVDRACGLMVPGIDNSLANYTYTDEYTTVPNSGKEWLEETPIFVDRTLVVPSETTDQIMGDFVFDINLTTIVPSFRLPGIDKL